MIYIVLDHENEIDAAYEDESKADYHAKFIYNGRIMPLQIRTKLPSWILQDDRYTVDNLANSADNKDT